MQIELKAKHFFLISHILQESAYQDVYLIQEAIKKQVTNDTDDEDLLTVTVTAQDLMLVYPLISAKPEGLMAEINKEMDKLLIPQVQAGMQGAESEQWGQVMAFIKSLKDKNTAVLSEMIAKGKALNMR